MVLNKYIFENDYYNQVDNINNKLYLIYITSAVVNTGNSYDNTIFLFL